MVRSLERREQKAPLTVGYLDRVFFQLPIKLHLRHPAVVCGVFPDPRKAVDADYVVAVGLNVNIEPGPDENREDQQGSGGGEPVPNLDRFNQFHKSHDGYYSCLAELVPIPAL